MDWDDSVILEMELEEGQEIVPPSNPAREGYTFVGWDQEFSVSEKDLKIKAIYEQNSYTVRFYDDQWNLLKEENVLHGNKANPPKVADRGNEEFSHWDKSVENITSDLDVIAVFKEKTFKLEFYDGNTKMSLGILSYRPSENLILPIPTKEGYVFSGWFLSEISLYEITQLDSLFIGDLKLYSRWVKTTSPQLTVPTNAQEFVQINRNPHSSGNGYVYQPQFPAGAPTTSVTQYNWESSDTKIATISSYSSISIVSSGYAVIKATLKTDPNVVYYCVIQTTADGVKKVSLEEANAPQYVTVKFKPSDDEEIKKIVQKGSYVVPPTAPHRNGYIFTGWVGENGEEIYNITKDTTFIPTYEVGNKSYAGKTISVLGDSISTYLGYIPTGFSNFYPYPTADIADVNQTWWMQFINHFGFKLLVNNSYSGTTVAGTSDTATSQIARLKHLSIGQVNPDVILIFIGVNDAASPYITLNQFDSAYGQMINNIQTLYPNSEIIVCKLPSLPMDKNENYISYNQVITKYANMHSLTLINFDELFPSNEVNDYLVDSAHPNKAGMDRLAEIIIRDFKEKTT